MGSFIFPALPMGFHKWSATSQPSEVMSFVERRNSIWYSAATIAVVFSAGVVSALAFDRVPTWQNHGPDAGPGFVRRAANPGMYYWMTSAYAAIAAVAWALAFFRFPRFRVSYLRLVFAALLLYLAGMLVYSLSMAGGQRQREQAAWTRIGALGGHGVWEPDRVVVSLAKMRVSDDDLALFNDFRRVQMLDLSDTAVTEKGLEYLDRLNELKSLVLVRTKIEREAIERFKAAHPNVDVQTERRVASWGQVPDG